MKLRRWWKAFLLLFLLVVVFAGFRVARYGPAPASGEANPLELRGAIHVHSQRSDGLGDLDTIAHAARQAGLDFVVVTDHRDLEALGEDEYRHGVLLLKGVEISTHGGHILALGIERPDFRFDGDPGNVFADIEDLGGFSIVAHPTSTHPERRFSYEGFPAFDGIEIVNGSEDLREPSLRTVTSALLALVNPNFALVRALRPLREGLDVWDRALSERRVFAFAGSDAHGGIRLGTRYLPFPKYRHLFELFSNHVILTEALTGDATEDRKILMESLRAGRAYVALDGVAAADGFSVRAEAPNGIVVHVPNADSEIVVLRNGEVIARSREQDFEMAATEPGVYRVEVFYRAPSPLDPTIPWIVTNPMYFHVAPPPKAPRPPMALPDDGVPVTFDWDTEADARSRVSPPRLGEGRAAAFDFTMGDRESAEDRSHVAMTASTPAGIAKARGISLSYRASGVFRFDLQLRDRNEASKDGIEPWRSSLKTSTEWQRAYIPFEELTSYHPRSDGRFDPDEAVGIAVYLDTATVRPGVSGSVSIQKPDLHPGR